jgi:hypothetical protein
VATGIGTGSSVNDKLESIRKETVYPRIWLGGGGSWEQQLTVSGQPMSGSVFEIGTFWIQSRNISDLNAMLNWKFWERMSKNQVSKQWIKVETCNLS